MKKSVGFNPYTNIVLRLNANRRFQWQLDMKVSSYMRGVDPLFVQSEGLWLPDVMPCANVEDAASIILRLVSEQRLPYA